MLRTNRKSLIKILLRCLRIDLEQGDLNSKTDQAIYHHGKYLLRIVNDASRTKSKRIDLGVNSYSIETVLLLPFEDTLERVSDLSFRDSNKLKGLIEIESQRTLKKLARAKLDFKKSKKANKKLQVQKSSMQFKHSKLVLSMPLKLRGI